MVDSSEPQGEASSCGNISWRRLGQPPGRDYEFYGGELRLEVGPIHLTIQLLDDGDGLILAHGPSTCCGTRIYYPFLLGRGQMGDVALCQDCLKAVGEGRKIRPEQFRSYLSGELPRYFCIDFYRALDWATQIDLWAAQENIWADLEEWMTVDRPRRLTVRRGQWPCG